jgi:two-component system, LytTR family, sensor histidine kinase AgrC
VILNVFGTLRYSLLLVFGIAVSFLFTGIPYTRTSKRSLAVFYIFIGIIQVFCMNMFGLKATTQMYPFITHLPLILFLILYFKRPWPISINCVLTTYLCCQIPSWISGLTDMVTGNPLAVHIAYIVTMGVVYYLLKKFIADSVRQLFERSTLSCLLFGAVPLLYYLFDYITTVYTNLLFSGSRAVVQFAPSLISTIYFVFVLYYNNESQKQSIAQRERDIFASQLGQANLELNTLRQMHHNTLIYRHDMSHHLSLLRSYSADGDLRKIKEYLSRTQADIDSLTPVRYCVNETVNLIISNFVTRAKKAGVVLQADIKLPEELAIKDNELCALLSNALENAINAAAQVEDEKLRKVFIHAVINNNRLVISTENAYSGTLEMNGELPKSSNKEPGHGFGVKSIVSIVERHGGLYSIETEGGVFVLQLMIPLSSKR